MPIDKTLFGYLSIAFMLLSGIPYVASILKGKTRPHIFTWILWSVLTCVVGAAQYAGHAGPGAWGALMTGICSLVIVALAFSHGDRTIKPIDWIAFAVGMAAIPLWYFTSDPLAAVLLVTFIDAVGYVPTLRKSYAKPHEEMVFSYLVSNFKFIASIFATVEYSATTLAYPVVLLIMNNALIATLVWRRYALKRQASL